jgi:lantibiotic modifying enzyme
MLPEITPVWKKPDLKDYLRYAEETGRWLRSIEIRKPGGSFWLKDLSGKTEHGHIDLYHGSAGIIVFFIQLADVSGDSSWLEDAKRGGDYILARFRESSFDAITGAGVGGNHYKTGVRWTLYVGGWAGIAFSLIELFRASGEQKYRDAALEISEEIAANAREEKGALIWSGKPGINFDSGIILFLLYAARFFKRPQWLEPAARAGRDILSTGKPKNGGIRYDGFESMVAIMFGIHNDGEAHMPGFAYGTAGISYTLARLYQETGDQAFLEGAKAGAAYVTGVAHTEGDAALVPHRIPEWSNLFYLGHCHGVVGTGKLFYLLHEITGESLYAEWQEKLVRGLLKTGAPEIHSPGYWHCFSWCCGTAGFVNLFTGIYLKRREEPYLEYARRSGNVILSEASVDASGVKWYQMFKRVAPNEVSLEPGYGPGAAGIAAALLHLNLAEQGRAPVIRFPDEPYCTGAAGSV